MILETSMRAPRRAFAWATAAALSCGSVSAMAAEPGPDTLPIHVIAIQTADADDQAEALTKALRVAVRQVPGWSLGEGDYSLEVLALSLKCPEPPDANCQSRIADQIKSDRYVWGTLKKKDKKSGMVSGDLNLWIRGKGTSKFPIEYSGNLTDQNDDSLRRIATDAINNLTGGPPKGSIHVHAGNVAGQVFLDGQPVGALKNGDGTFMVPAGSHKLTVKAVGFADTERQITVKPTGAPLDVALTLTAGGDRTPVNGKRIGGYAALGAGVVFGVVGFVSMAQVKSAQGAIDDVRQNTPSNVDVCDNMANPGIVSACNKGKTFQTVQIAMFPLAAVAAGAGIYLIATSGKSAPKTGSLQFLPQVGPQGGRLDVTYSF
ncbi:Hypothetical protein A7982_08882 [Minicystis rosea]|nr:Hypothetical protein A7982_08882 [Minicystis rosea]